jgi:hypothetical protein
LNDVLPRSPHSGASPEQLRFLREVRDTLLELHAALLHVERRSYERTSLPPTPFELLRLLTESPQFAWLRPVSILVAEIDDLMDAVPPSSAVSIVDVTRRVASLVRLEVAPEDFKTRYRDALQESIDVAGLHADLRRLLAGQ